MDFRKKKDKNKKDKEEKKSSSGKDYTLCIIPLYAGVIDLEIGLSFSISCAGKYEANEVTVELNGKIDLKAEVNAGGWFIKASMGVKGNMIDATFSNLFTEKYGLYYLKNSNLKLGAGSITGYLNGAIFGVDLVNEELEIWKGFNPITIF